MTRQAICTPHPLATNIGAEILKSDGTAIDAMIAAGATLAVVYPHMTGIGGDALWLLYDGKVRPIMGFGQAGKELPKTETLNGTIPVRGKASACTTAAAMASWKIARHISVHQWHSPLPWPLLFEDAIDRAKRGTLVSQSQAFWIRKRQDWLRTTTDIAHLYRNSDNSIMQENDVIFQHHLATSLSHIARYGIDSFYQGELAQAIAEGFNQLECGLTKNDLSCTKAQEIQPINIRYRRGNYYNFPPPSQGYYTAQAMATLNDYRLDELGNKSTSYYHVLVEAIKHQLHLRNQYLCDPKYIDVSRRAVDAHYIDMKRAQTWSEQGQAADTIWMSATDKYGRTACLMQSLFHDFGSGCVVGDTGIVWHNRGSSFQSNPKHPNVWSAGKRPAHTLNPSCYLSDSGKQFFFGSQGGDGQPQTQLVIATQLIDFNQSAQDALAAPRFLLGRSFFDSTDGLKVEKNVGVNVISELRQRQHDIEIVSPLSPLTGQAGILSREGNNIEAAHDPRGQGTSIII